MCERNIDRLPLVHTPPGIKPAPTGDWTCNPGLCPDQELNQQLLVVERCPTHWATLIRASSGIFWVKYLNNVYDGNSNWVRNWVEEKWMMQLLEEVCHNLGKKPDTGNQTQPWGPQLRGFGSTHCLPLFDLPTGPDSARKCRTGKCVRNTGKAAPYTMWHLRPQAAPKWDSIRPQNTRKRKWFLYPF